MSQPSCLGKGGDPEGAERGQNASAGKDGVCLCFRERAVGNGETQADG